MTDLPPLWCLRALPGGTEALRCADPVIARAASGPAAQPAADQDGEDHGERERGNDDRRGKLVGLFLGRATADAARADGWEVTIFRRGRGDSGTDPSGVRTVHGDYTSTDDLARLAAAGPFDRVVDNLAFTPRDTLAAARALQPVAGQYVMVSSVSAYQGWPLEPFTEDSATLPCEPDAGPTPATTVTPAPRRTASARRGVSAPYATCSAPTAR